MTGTALTAVASTRPKILTASMLIDKKAMRKK